MPGRVIGLDIGSHAVRAAAVRTGAKPELLAFGQVGLPRGAVEHGEVIDPGTVASAIRRLWWEAPLRDRRVRIGLANLRTIVRQVELPAMDDDELRGAIEFQVGDFIPLPAEEVVLDFRVLERFVGDDDEPMVRVLLAAIHRDTLDNALSAVREAGLQTVAVDLIPFALVRGVGREAAPDRPDHDDTTDADDPDDAASGAPADDPAERGDAVAEAIVSIGSGVTVVSVHELGVPRFVRIIDSGGDDLTDAVRSVLDLSFDEAELLKRGLGGPADRRDEALAAMEGALSGLVNDIRGSIDFYATQAETRPLGRLLFTGGGALTEGLLGRFRELLAIPVEMATPRRTLAVGEIGFLPDELDRLDPYLGVPVGLALGGDKLAAARINLLPSSERRVVPVSRLVFAGVLALVLLVAALFFLTNGRNDEIASQQEQLEQQEQVNAGLRSRVAELSRVEDLQDQASDVRSVLAGITATDVSWSRVLQEVARVIPGDVWLENVNAQVTPAEGGAPFSGSVTFSAQGADLPATAAWLQRLASAPSFFGPWVSEAREGEAEVGEITLDTVTFSSTASLTPAALSARAKSAAEQAPAGEAPGATPESGAAADDSGEGDS